VFSRLGEVNEIEISFPSCMKHIFPLDIKIDGCLKVKRHTLVVTNNVASSNSKEQIKGDGQASSHRITVQEGDYLENEIESAQALETSENGEGFQHGPTDDKFLKHYVP